MATRLEASKNPPMMMSLIQSCNAENDSKVRSRDFRSDCDAPWRGVGDGPSLLLNVALDVGSVLDTKVERTSWRAMRASRIDGSKVVASHSILNQSQHVALVTEVDCDKPFQMIEERISRLVR